MENGIKIQIDPSPTLVHPENKNISRDDICEWCKPLSFEQEETFEEVADIIKKSGRRIERNANRDKLIEELRQKFSEENPTREKYLQVVTLHNPSEHYQCDTLLHLAADNSDYEIMHILLKTGADPNATNLHQQLPLHTVVDEGDGCHCDDCNAKNAKCVGLLLRYGSNTDNKDWEKDTPLGCAGLSMMDDCAALLWKGGASIHKGCEGENAGQLVVQYIPEEVKNWLDKAIQQDEKYKLKLHLDFGAILGGVSTDNEKTLKKETHFLNYMCTAHKKAREILLLHPLVQAYLHLKWDAVYVLFHLLRLAYLGIVILYTFFIIIFFLHNCPFEAADQEEEAEEETLKSSKRIKDLNSTASETMSIIEGQELCEPTPLIYTLACFLIMFVVCMVVNEMYELAQGLKDKRYFKTPLNYGWWLMVITVTINILPVFISSYTHSHWQYVSAAFGVLLAWGMFMSQLARDPKVGIYVEMLGSVVKEFLTFSATYLALLIGFASAFAVLFPQNSMFEYEYGFLPLVKSLLIMNGETDYETLFDPEENDRVSNLEYSIGAHIIFVGFIIVMTILLMNLLMGLAITDIQELKKKATLSKTERLIQQIDLLETLFHKRWMPQAFQDLFDEKFSIRSQCEFYSVENRNDESDDSSDSENEEEDAEEKEKCQEFEEEYDFKLMNDISLTCKVKVKGNGFVEEEYDHPSVKRVGPILRGFEPLKKTVLTFPDDLKEAFIPFVDKSECSKKKYL